MADCFSQEEEKKVKEVEIEEAQGKNRRRMLGNIKFIGELFKLEVCLSNIDCRYMQSLRRPVFTQDNFTDRNRQKGLFCNKVIRA